jgi:hypothetical protein
VVAVAVVAAVAAVGCLLSAGSGGVRLVREQPKLARVRNPRCGLWAVGCGLWAVGCGLWAVGCGLWAVGCGLWVVALRVACARSISVAASAYPGGFLCAGAFSCALTRQAVPVQPRRRLWQGQPRRRLGRPSGHRLLFAAASGAPAQGFPHESVPARRHGRVGPAGRCRSARGPCQRPRRAVGHLSNEVGAEVGKAPWGPRGLPAGGRRVCAWAARVCVGGACVRGLPCCGYTRPCFACVRSRP